jgi:hypothetical protein
MIMNTFFGLKYVPAGVSGEMFCKFKKTTVLSNKKRV